MSSRTLITVHEVVIEADDYDDATRLRDELRAAGHRASIYQHTVYETNAGVAVDRTRTD